MTTVSPKSISDNIIAWFVGIVLVCFGISCFSMPQNHLFPLRTRLDLGNVSVGQTSEKAFLIFNHTSKPIIIDGWSPTCHCIQASFPQTLVPEEKFITAYVKTSATTPLGKRASVIAIQWHFVGDSQVRTDNLIVSAKYISPLSLSEARLDFGTVPSLKGTRTKSLFVRAGNAAGNWNGLDIAPFPDRLSARIQSTASGFQVQVQINPQGLPAGIWKSTIRLFTLQNRRRTGEEVDIPVVAKIEGPFSICPSVLQFFDQSNHALYFTLKVHSSTAPIRKLCFAGNIVRKSTIEITNDGKDAIVTGFLVKPVSKEIFVGRIPLQINDCPEGSLQMSFIGYPG